MSVLYKILCTFFVLLLSVIILETVNNLSKFSELLRNMVNYIKIVQVLLFAVVEIVLVSTKRVVPSSRMLRCHLL